MTVEIRIGDARALLAAMPDASVHCCVTSPPYYGLRDYGVAGQMGLEPTLADYIAGMVDLFREVRRVLREDGTCWLNMGDSYANNPSGGRDPVIWPKQHRNDHKPERPPNWRGFKQKDLMMVPARLAIALQDDGWWVRKDIIWHKPNPMPESCTDRPTSSHEHIFLLAKAERYFFDAEAVKEGRTSNEDANTFRGGAYVGGNTDNDMVGKRTMVGNKRVRGVPPRHARYESSDQSGLDDVGRGGGRNIRDVWTIATAPFPEAHFATFPPALPEQCIKAATSERGCCPACGAPWARVLAKIDTGRKQKAADGWDAGPGGHGTVHREGRQKGEPGVAVMVNVTTGWQPTCGCPLAEPVPCTVLDPFGGAGTTGMVAQRLGRDAILLELNPDYAAMAEKRLAADRGELPIEGVGLFGRVA